jgi:hypothetical protein
MTTGHHTSRYVPANKNDKDCNREVLLGNDSYVNVEENHGVDTDTHTHRYVPAQRTDRKWLPVPLETGHTSRYVPVTRKDLQLNRDDLLHCESYKNMAENEGMDTHTHTHRYVPAQRTDRHEP